MQSTIPAAFTSDTQATIAALCSDLTQRIKRKVTADYGATDCGRLHDVALSLADDSLPYPLASILAGPGIPDGFAVLGSFDDTAAEGMSLADAVNTARFEAVRNYRAMRKAA